MRHNAAIVWHKNVHTRNVLGVIFFNFSEPERLPTYQNVQTEKPARLPIVYKPKLCFQEKLILSAVLVLITPGLQCDHAAGYQTSTNKSRKSAFMRSLIFGIYLQNILCGFKTRHASTETQNRRLTSCFSWGLCRVCYTHTPTPTHTQTHYITAVPKSWLVKATTD